MGKVKIKIGLIILAVFLFAEIGKVWAVDDGLSLVVSPLPINLVSEPGATVSAQLKVKNGGLQPETLEVGLMKFSAYGEDGQPRLTDREKGDDYFDWVTFSENDFILNPNEWKTVTAYFNVPKSAAFGYYYAITFQRKNNDIAGGPRSTKVVGATALLVLLEVRVPNAVRNVEVLDFSTPRKVYEFLPTKFNIKLKNKGNVHVAPTGNIFIDRWGQKDVALLTINENKGNVLPDSNRIFESEWKDGFPVYEQKMANKTVVADKNGKPVYQLKWDFSQVPKLRWGKYTANMLLVYDDGTRDIPIEGKLEFWVIPWRLLGGALVIVMLVFMGLYTLIWVPVRKLRDKLRKK
jgi:hypothetical protein